VVGLHCLIWTRTNAHVAEISDVCIHLRGNGVQSLIQKQSAPKLDKLLSKMVFDVVIKLEKIMRNWGIIVISCSAIPSLSR
jgi:hypothetical protein